MVHHLNRLSQISVVLNLSYVNEAGLTEILSQKIDQGFTFPLNPKWVLCDSNRWYELYQKLLRSDDDETQQSMKIWYPPDHGLRDQVERIHRSRPEGFYQAPEELDESGVASNLNTSTTSKGKPKDHLLSLFAMGMMDKSEYMNQSRLSQTERSDDMDASGGSKVGKAMGKVKKGAKKVLKKIH